MNFDGVVFIFAFAIIILCIVSLLTDGSDKEGLKNRADQTCKPFVVESYSNKIATCKVMVSTFLLQTD